jgi:DNA-binding SARP family transcriptional activator/tetratricopeptide (TPR) repeat protein
MQVRLLGPVDVVVDGEPRPVRGLRRKAILAALALNHGTVVSSDRLIDLVWGEAAPPTAPNTLQAHVSYLRGVLGSRAGIVARQPGYVVDLGDDGTDVRVAERLLRHGARSADPVRGARLLRDALALWRGRPLADLTGLAWFGGQAGQLDALWMRTTAALAEARLVAGDHAALVPDLEPAVAEHPLDEQLHALLMLALYRAGGQAEALACYQRLRRALDAELGVGPGPALRDLHAAILRQDPALELPVAAVTGTSPSPVPAQLPPAVPAFTGRAAELASLDAMLAPAAGPATMAIVAVTGTAGVGKTALAVHWAHRASPAFPDGQLYVNLRGFDPVDPVSAAMTPGEALLGFLAALGVPSARIPPGLSAQTGLYRSLLAGRRVLVVLDNARDAGQVRALLPGSPGCLTLLTSRDHLTGLIAAEGARPLPVPLLPVADARELLTRRLGADRVASEPAAADAILERCAGLPLALTVTSARAAGQPGFPLAVIAVELSQGVSALDPFASDDLATDLRAVFTSSYRALNSAAARLFRLLGLHPGPDVPVLAAASLAAVSPARAHALLAELTRAHLLGELAPGRYSCHDLLRAYAAEQAQAQDSREAREAAVRRLLEHYLHTAVAGAALLESETDPIRLAPPPPGVSVAEPGSDQEALHWFTAEHAGLLAAVQLAAREGLDTCAGLLARALTPFQLRRGLWDEQAAACLAALEAAQVSGRLGGQAYALHGLAVGYARSGRFADAEPVLRHAGRLFEQVGNQAGQARIENQLTWLAERDQRPGDALGHAQRALEYYVAAGHRTGQAMTLNDIGYCQAQLGGYEQGIARCEQAVAILQEVGERGWEAAAWDSLGFIHYRLGEHARAIAAYRRSAALYRDLTDHFNEADTLGHLGDVQHDAGDRDGAARSWHRALRLLDEIGHPDADQIRAKLRVVTAAG